MVKVFVNTWGNYNENGADGGQWITLPMDNDELCEKLDEIAEAMNDHDPEWAIHDYEWECEDFGSVSECENIAELNECAQELENMQEWERETAAAYLEAEGGSLRNAIDSVDRCTLYAGQDMEDVAYDMLNECYEIPDYLQNYIDYAAFARDISFDGYTETSFGVLYVG